MQESLLRLITVNILVKKQLILMYMGSLTNIIGYWHLFYDHGEAYCG